MKKNIHLALLLGAWACLVVAPQTSLADQSVNSDSSSRSEAAADAEAPEDAPLESFFAETTITATGSEVDSFEVSTPVTVLDRDTLDERMPENAAELLRTEPGVDVNGVGPNQSVASAACACCSWRMACG